MNYTMEKAEVISLETVPRGAVGSASGLELHHPSLRHPARSGGLLRERERERERENEREREREKSYLRASEQSYERYRVRNETTSKSCLAMRGKIHVYFNTIIINHLSIVPEHIDGRK